MNSNGAKTFIFTPLAAAFLFFPGTGAAQIDATATERAGAVLKQYCQTCHNEKAKVANLALTSAGFSDIPGQAEIWEKVVRKLRTKTMPPENAPRPDQASYDSLAMYLEAKLDAAAAENPKPGRPESVHRLNRTEYQNAVRDMLALDIDTASLLPADDQSYGFDNIAGVLKISPTLLERYMAAARYISRLAVGVTKVPPTAETIRLRSDFSQYDHIEGLPLGTRGGAGFQFNFPQDGEYVISAALLDLFFGAGVKEKHQLEFAIDGKRVQMVTLMPKVRGAAPPRPPENGGQDKGKPGQLPENPAPADSGFGPAKPDQWEVRTPVTAGPHWVTVTFLKKTDALAESMRTPFSRPHGENDYLLYEPHLGTITVTGPFNPKGVGETPSRKRIFACHPSSESSEAPCARQIISRLTKLAYRRPVAETDINRLVAFYKEGRDAGGFEVGIERALRAILVSPDFLYRVELDSAQNGVSNRNRRLSDIELASRLSFFLWSSIPDQELIDVASEGRLHDPAVLEQQVRRMLQDSRSAALSQNFAGQWLHLRNVRGQQPDDVLFPNFSENLRQDFTKETELLFDSIVKEDRSILDLITADYSFLNERLAQFYNVPGVHGDYFRRVKLTDPNRYGLIGQASILMITSYSDRTSVVGRGKWILENVLGAPPPPPPPNVPALKENGQSGKMLSMRERMLQHRANPACASCHSRMDPLGFALENFDAIGRWRTVAESGELIDSSGEMPDGAKFNGPGELRKLLMRDPQQFATVVAEKLFVYGLGRGLGYYDQPTIRQVVRASAKNDYSFGSLVVGLVQSVPFTQRAIGTPALAASK